jgi:hypothetical protein
MVRGFPTEKLFFLTLALVLVMLRNTSANSGCFKKKAMITAYVSITINLISFCVIDLLKFTSIAKTIAPHHRGQDHAIPVLFLSRRDSLDR